MITRSQVKGNKLEVFQKKQQYILKYNTIQNIFWNYHDIFLMFFSIWLMCNAFNHFNNTIQNIGIPIKQISKELIVYGEINIPEEIVLYNASVKDILFAISGYDQGLLVKSIISHYSNQADYHLGEIIFELTYVVEKTFNEKISNTIENTHKIVIPESGIYGYVSGLFNYYTGATTQRLSRDTIIQLERATEDITIQILRITQDFRTTFVRKIGDIIRSLELNLVTSINTFIQGLLILAYALLTRFYKIGIMSKNKYNQLLLQSK